MIGTSAFWDCDSLKHVYVPSSVKTIKDFTFEDCSKLEFLDLCVGLETIENCAFSGCTSLRRVFVPHSVKTIKSAAFVNCESLVSVDFGDELDEIWDSVFSNCHKLRNLIIPYTVTHLGPIFKPCDYDFFLQVGEHRTPQLLAQKFPNDDDDCTKMTDAFKENTRFDGLPIHSLCYYQPHYPEMLEALRDTVKSDRLSGETSDTFGMTPLHILALSARPDIELMEELLKVYPAVTFVSRKDVWGNQAVDYLIQYESPESDAMANQLLQIVLTDRIKWLGLETWKANLMNETQDFPKGCSGVDFRERRLEMIYSELAKYERLEILSLLEMVLWSMQIDENFSGRWKGKSRRKKIKTSNDIDRQSCRIKCGAEIIIINILPFLDLSESIEV